MSVEEIDATRGRTTLRRWSGRSREIDPAGAPPGRGIPLAERDREIRHWLARFDGDPTVTAEWERALAAPAWDGPPVWHHGDLDARNWLVRGGRIRGVIDWGAMGAGDPACDLMVAWKLHSPAARDAFRDALPADDATLCDPRRCGYSRKRSRSSPTTPRRTILTSLPRGGELARPRAVGARARVTA